ncbi:hypothetical protein GCM10023187_25780 [Nibrella viscosa]|uniref:Putative beta-lactamase-inhibitor-like PepSY-like domain-containing protein n=1 Tax=Nibrella viscosa TaxID=1084524 RepID=A0ABP8KG24_9BACT
MKKLCVLFMLFTIVWVSSCRRLEVQPDDSAGVVDKNFANVPAVVVQAVRKAYPAATSLSFSEIDKGNVWESRFVVEAKNRQARINAKGTMLEDYAVAASGERSGVGVSLPTAAQEYIQKNYPDYKLIAAGEGRQNEKKAYKVLLRREKEEVTLVFDEKGALLLEFKATVSATPTDDMPKNYPIGRADDLPAPIRQYLQENGLTFAKGLVVMESESKKIYYIVAQKGDAIYELSFGEDGKLVKASVSVPPVALKSVNDLPAAAVAYLTGYTFERGMLLTDKDGKKTYTAVVYKDGKRYEMAFSSEGKLLRSTMTPPEPQAIKSVSELPEAIRTYLKEYTFEKGMKYFDNEGHTFYEIAASKNGTMASFVFDGDGKLIKSSQPTPKQEEKPLTAGTLPGPIVEYLNATYKSWTFVKGNAILLDGKLQRYNIQVQVEKTSYILTFNAEGKFEVVKKG